MKTVPMKRIHLRPLRADDLDAFYTYRSDPNVARLQGWEPYTRQAAADFLARCPTAIRFVPGQWIQLGIADLRTDGLVGDLGVFLSPDESSAELGVTITPASQGKGYATEAIVALQALLFTTTSVATISANTDTRNASCIAALKRAGMAPVAERIGVYKGETCREIVFAARRTAHCGDTKKRP